LLNSDQDLPLIGDKIIALNGSTIFSWPQFLRTVQQLPFRHSADGVPNTVKLSFYRPSDNTNHEAVLLYDQTSLENMIPSFLWLALKMAMVFAGGLILWWKPADDHEGGGVTCACCVHRLRSLCWHYPAGNRVDGLWPPSQPANKPAPRA